MAHAEPYYRRLAQSSSKFYNLTLTTVVVPVRDGAVLVWQSGHSYYSLVISKVNDSEMAGAITSRFSQAKSQLHGQYLRLDFDEDGKVSIEDFKNTARAAYAALREVDYKAKGQDIYQRAMSRARAMIAQH